MSDPLHERLLVPLLNRLLRPHGAVSAQRDQSGPVEGALDLGVQLPMGIGQSSGYPSRVTLSLDERRIHLYALGRSGSGKTTLLLKLILDDLMAARVVIVVDLRGDLVEQVLGHIVSLRWPESEVARRLWLLDFREQGWSVPMNPLAAEDGNHQKDPHARALLVLETLRTQAESWGVQLEETLRNSLLALASSGGTLAEVEPLLSDPGMRSRVLASVTDPEVLRFFARFDAQKPDRQNDWRAAVANKVTPLLAEPSVRRALGQGEALPLRKILDRTPGAVILVSLASDRLHGAARLMGGLLMAQLETAVTARADQAERDRVPCSLYVDEFENFAGERFETLIVESRKFGLSLTLAHQNLSQLPAKLRDAVRSNVSTRFFFGVGAPDAAELAAEVGPALEMGRTSDLPSWQQPEDASRGGNREEAKRLLLSQATGETLLLRHPSSLLRVRVDRVPEPQVGTAAVKRVRELSFVAHARPAARADELLANVAPPLIVPPVVIPPATPAKKSRGGSVPPVPPPAPPSLAPPPAPDTSLNPAAGPSGDQAAPGDGDTTPIDTVDGDDTAPRADMAPRVRHGKTPGLFAPKP